MENMSGNNPWSPVKASAQMASYIEDPAQRIEASVEQANQTVAAVSAEGCRVAIRAAVLEWLVAAGPLSQSEALSMLDQLTEAVTGVTQSTLAGISDKLEATGGMCDHQLPSLPACGRDPNDPPAELEDVLAVLDAAGFTKDRRKATGASSKWPTVKTDFYRSGGEDLQVVVSFVADGSRPVVASRVEVVSADTAGTDREILFMRAGHITKHDVRQVFCEYPPEEVEKHND